MDIKDVIETSLNGTPERYVSVVPSREGGMFHTWWRHGSSASITNEFSVVDITSERDLDRMANGDHAVLLKYLQPHPEIMGRYVLENCNIAFWGDGGSRGLNHTWVQEFAPVPAFELAQT